jgi:uncharacterized protein YecE (DUF72 family)
MSTLPLFEDPLPELAAQLQPRLADLAQQQIYLGTSSWKYEGWMGQIYTPERYFTRGRFSQKRFETECLEEYAKTFPIVCGDFSFYQFPSQAHWQKLFGSAPRELLYAFKVPEDITVKHFPKHDRYGARAGMPNDTFLNPVAFTELFAGPLQPYQSQVATLIFEFGTFSKSSLEDGPPFFEQLEKFLSGLPKGFRYAIEIRNPEFLTPGYFDLLHRHNVAHVFNSWTRMPDLRVQSALLDAYTADFMVVRALLRHGRSYEEAVQKFAPYTHIQEPNPGARDAIRRIIARSKKDQRAAFIFVNNRLEGNAPQSIAAIID